MVDPPNDHAFALAGLDARCPQHRDERVWRLANRTGARTGLCPNGCQRSLIAEPRCAIVEDLEPTTGMCRLDLGNPGCQKFLNRHAPLSRAAGVAGAEPVRKSPRGCNKP